MEAKLKRKGGGGDTSSESRLAFALLLMGRQSGAGFYILTLVIQNKEKAEFWLSRSRNRILLNEMK